MTAVGRGRVLIKYRRRFTPFAVSRPSLRSRLALLAGCSRLRRSLFEALTPVAPRFARRLARGSAARRFEALAPVAPRFARRLARGSAARRFEALPAVAPRISRARWDSNSMARLTAFVSRSSNPTSRMFDTAHFARRFHGHGGIRTHDHRMSSPPTTLDGIEVRRSILAELRALTTELPAVDTKGI